MAWDYEGYWNVVLGHRSAEQVVAEFELDPSDRRGLDEWLGEAEAEAWRVGGEGGAMPEEWGDFHARALDALCATKAEALDLHLPLLTQNPPENTMKKRIVMFCDRAYAIAHIASEAVDAFKIGAMRGQELHAVAHDETIAFVISFYDLDDAESVSTMRAEQDEDVVAKVLATGADLCATASSPDGAEEQEA